MQVDLRSKILTHGIFWTATAAILAQIAISTVHHLESGGDWWAGIWRLYGFFTLWTNSIVPIVFGILLLRPQQLQNKGWQSLMAFLSLHLCVVALVYNIFLRPLYHPEGVEYATNLVFHVSSPLGVGIFWYRFSPKNLLSVKDLKLWIGYPIFYFLYAEIRGWVTGWYPYYFFDPAKIGLSGVVLAVVLLTLLFLALSMLVLRLSRRQRY